MAAASASTAATSAPIPLDAEPERQSQSAGDRRVIMRPSGTEPKLKNYYEPLALDRERPVDVELCLAADELTSTFAATRPPCRNARDVVLRGARWPVL